MKEQMIVFHNLKNKIFWQKIKICFCFVYREVVFLKSVKNSYIKKLQQDMDQMWVDCKIFKFNSYFLLEVYKKYFRIVVRVVQKNKNFYFRYFKNIM